MGRKRHRGWRYPIFYKFLTASLLLAGLIIGGWYGWTKYKFQPVRASAFLNKHHKRYDFYMAGLSQAHASVASVLAETEPFQAALAGGAATREEAARLAKRAYTAITGKHAVRPDVFVVFDANGNEVFAAEGSAIGGRELPDVEAVGRVRAGNRYFDELVLHGDDLLVAAGVPVRSGPDGQVVGGVLIGVRLVRYFEEFQKQSDEDAKKQHRMSVVRDGRVLASVFPAEKHAELAAAVVREKRVTEKVGQETLTFIKFEGTLWDFHEAPVSGFAGQGYGSLGSVYLMRQRTPPKVESLTVPVAIGIGGALIVAAVMGMWITRSVKKLNAATREIAAGAGDLTRRIDVDCSDEISDLADNLNKVFDNLHKLAHDVQSASFQVGASSAEISAASKQMLEGVKDQAVKIEGSTAAVTELSSSIQQVASNAIEATRVAQQSNEAVAAAQESMSRIRRTVEEAADKIQELGESGKRIGNIVEVIRQISEQTSLLALNASIEAAHAGEQGRGFAVVADEVSSLARRVGQSAKDIEDLIATIKDQTSDAVRAMQVGTKEVEAGTSSVTGTLANLRQIIEMVQDTANAVQEQAIVSDEIARNMDAVQKIAGEVLASSEEAVIQGEQLHSLAHHLEESVRGFNLEPGSSPAAAEGPPPAAPAPPAASQRQLPPGRDGGPARSATAARAAAGGASKPHKPSARG